MTESTTPSPSEFGPNSYSTKKPPVEKGDPKDKVVERVTTSEVVTKKKPLGRKIVESFAGEDVHSVGRYVVTEIMLPYTKTLITDVVSQGIERLLFGDKAPRRSGSIGGRVDYSGISTNRTIVGSNSIRPTSNIREVSSRARATHDFSEVIVRDRAEAELVLDRLVDLVEKYDAATVSDLYSLVGAVGSFVDDKWGWTDLRDARIRRVSGGFLVDLPRTVQLD